MSEVPIAAVSRCSTRRPYSITSSARASSVGGTVKPSALRGLEIENQFEPRRLLHRQIGRLGTFQDFVDVGRAFAHPERARAVLDQAALLCGRAGRRDRRKPALQHQCDGFRARQARLHDQRLRRLAVRRGKSRAEVVGGAQHQRLDVDAHPRRRGLDLFEERFGERACHARPKLSIPEMSALPAERGHRKSDAKCQKRTSRAYSITPSAGGSTTSNIEPCGCADDADNRPPWASTMERQIESPMPMPSDLVVKNVSKTRPTLSGSMPVPEFRHCDPHTRGRALRGDTQHPRPALDGTHGFDGIVIRLRNTSCSWTRLPSTPGNPSASSVRTATRPS